MTTINGVHALLAFLVQQAQPSRKIGEIKVDVKNLDALLQESRVLNERLLKIERLLAVPSSRDLDTTDMEFNPLAKPEGNWPAASFVRDAINRQERHQSFGKWQADEATEAEPFTHREIVSPRQVHSTPDIQQVLIQRYDPSDTDIARAHMSANYGAHRVASDCLNSDRGEANAENFNGAGGRIFLISLGMSLILFLLFAGLS